MENASGLQGRLDAFTKKFSTELETDEIDLLAKKCGVAFQEAKIAIRKDVSPEDATSERSLSSVFLTSLTSESVPDVIEMAANVIRYRDRLSLPEDLNNPAFLSKLFLGAISTKIHQLGRKAREVERNWNASVSSQFSDGYSGEPVFDSGWYGEGPEVPNPGSIRDEIKRFEDLYRSAEVNFASVPESK